MSKHAAPEPVESPIPARAVVVGVDGTEHDAVVLTAAVAEAIRRDAPLHVRHCRELMDPASTFASQAPVFLDESTDTSAEVLGVSLATVRELAPDLAVTADRPGGRAENLLVQASETAALVVVGTGRKSRIDELLLGAVALNVAGHARCPVLVVPPGADPDGEGDVIVGVDGSTQSRAAVTHAVAAARSRGSRVVVITTWHLEVVDGYVVTEPDSPEWQQVEDRIRATQQKTLDGIDTEGVNLDFRVVKGPIRGTLAEASSGASLVVVGNRGRGGFRSKALGSVTMDLLRQSAAPLLVVHEGD